MPGRGRRVSDKKLASFTEVVGNQETEQQKRLLLDSVVAAVKAADLQTLLTVKRILDQGKEDSEPKPFPRGVRTLGGKASYAVPLYAVLDVLTAVTGLSEGDLRSVDDYSTSLRQAYLWAIDGEDDTPVPERMMLPEAFRSWYVEAYKQAGNKLQDKIQANCSLDWTTNLGHFCLVKSSPGIPVYDSVKCHKTQTVKKLDAIYHVPESEVGSAWEMKANHSLNSAELCGPRGQSLRMAAFFEEWKPSAPNASPKKRAAKVPAPSPEPAPTPKKSKKQQSSVEEDLADVIGADLAAAKSSAGSSALQPQEALAQIMAALQATGVSAADAQILAAKAMPSSSQPDAASDIEAQADGAVPSDKLVASGAASAEGAEEQGPEDAAENAAAEEEVPPPP